MDNSMKSVPCADFNINFLLVSTCSRFLLDGRKGAHGISGVRIVQPRCFANPKGVRWAGTRSSQMMGCSHQPSCETEGTGMDRMTTTGGSAFRIVSVPDLVCFSSKQNSLVDLLDARAAA